MIVLKPAEMRAVDKAAIEAGFPGVMLMEIAGRAVADKVVKFIEPGSKVLIFIGKGNNGGDGLVAARYLDTEGYNVQLILLAGEDSLSDSSLMNYRLCKLRSINTLKIDTIGTDYQEVKNLLAACDIVIDAILGTGISGSIRGRAADLIELINNVDKKVLAVDIPSGISGENGSVLGKAVKATWTLTMAYPKPGLLLYPGRKYCGQIGVVDLTVPEKFVLNEGCSHYTLTCSEALDWLPTREKTGHKGSFGKITVIGGSPGMDGAPVLTGLAALKTGAGLVRLAIPGDTLSISSAYSPELITTPLTKSDNNEPDWNIISKVMADSDMIVAGPGFGRSKTSSEVIKKLISTYHKPLLIDADGLNVIDDIKLLKQRKETLILTPHPGEMARLLDEEIKVIQQDRIKIARQFAVDKQLYLVLKGAATIIALPDGKIYINTTGNEGMATAGSGDTLAGIIAGLLSQGLAPEKAVVLGVYLHGLAGDLAVQDTTSYSLMAGDLIDYIPAAIKKLIAGSGGELK
ncbi:NAD(P)H-hydrate dehydratase [Iocasia frigidifontis]|uniref:Bifunctional NAD(P)H-hydrate repair enzyme n=1 Tax=Iocasia fonsfrigidae TaxID=2682810 RepID=A0A8A7KI56_9FIRM|nr:NAD(P)H-hydrate dehydratase [Iocasia fonsfrigidae]QTL99249.1 NAD(P)H-hydrate dehydratase [Iocasia fonsfrigidae]